MSQNDQKPLKILQHIAYQFKNTAQLATVDSLISGHHRENDFCPLIVGVRF